jgi:hypothetical protein
VPNAPLEYKSLPAPATAATPPPPPPAFPELVPVSMHNRFLWGRKDARRIREFGAGPTERLSTATDTGIASDDDVARNALVGAAAELLTIARAAPTPAARSAGLWVVVSFFVVEEVEVLVEVDDAANASCVFSVPAPPGAAVPLSDKPCLTASRRANRALPRPKAAPSSNNKAADGESVTPVDAMTDEEALLADKVPKAPLERVRYPWTLVLGGVRPPFPPPPPCAVFLKATGTGTGTATGVPHIATFVLMLRCPGVKPPNCASRRSVDPGTGEEKLMSRDAAMSRSDTDIGELNVYGECNTPPSPLSELQLYGALDSDMLRREGRGVTMAVGVVLPPRPMPTAPVNCACVGDWIS